MSYTLKYTGAEIDDILDRAAPGGTLDDDIAAKQDALTFDDAPEPGSNNPVKSGGIFDAIKNGTVSGAFHVLGGATPNKVPYVKRATPSFAGTLEQEKAVVGVSIANNQLVQNGDFSSGTSGWSKNSSASISVTGNVLTLAPSAASSSHRIYRSVSGVVGHKYYMVAYIKAADSSMAARIGIGSSNSAPSTQIESALGDTNWHTIGGIVSPADVGYIVVGIYGNVGTGYNLQIANVMLIDLTTAFGSTVADYLHSSADGAALVRAMLGDAYRAYDAGSIKSVNVSAHVLRDANDNIVGNYPLDAGGELRGIIKLDANNDLYADGDVYASDGTITRNYATRAYEAGDESLADAITDGTTTVYKATASTESGAPFTELQTCAPGGTEEYTQTGTVPVPVGHDTDYYGDAVPAAPSTDGTYTLQVVVSDGVPTYGWASGSGLMLSMSAPAISPSITPSLQHAQTEANILTDEPEAEEPAEEAEGQPEEPEEE